MTDQPKNSNPRRKSSIELAQDGARGIQRTVEAAMATGTSVASTPGISRGLQAAVDAARSLPLSTPPVSPTLQAAVDTAMNASISPKLLASVEAARATISAMPPSWLTGQQILGAIQSSATTSTVSDAAFTDYLRQISDRDRLRAQRMAELVRTYPAARSGAADRLRSAKDVSSRSGKVVAGAAEKSISQPAGNWVSRSDRKTLSRSGKALSQPGGKAASARAHKIPSDAQVVVWAIKEAVADLGSQVRDMGQIAAASSVELSGLRGDIQTSSKKAADLQTAANRIAIFLAALTIVLVVLTGVLISRG